MNNDLPFIYPRLSQQLECDVFDASIPPPINDEFKLFKDFLTNVKSSIYKSIEYKRFVKSQKINAGIPICAVSGLTNDIALHHHPLTLTNYVLTVLEYMQSCNFSFTSLSVADCVIRLHYKNIVCYTFLSDSYHSKFHDENNVDIAEDMIYGDMENLITDPIMKNMSEQTKGRFLEYCPEFCKAHKDFFNF